MSTSSTTAVLAQAGELQSADEPLVLALDRLAVDHAGASRSSNASAAMSGCSSLLLERLGHAGEAERDQPFVWLDA